MFKKVTFIFIILAVIFLCFSNVSADDVNGTDVSNFDDLAIEVNQTLDGQTLTLNSDYQSVNSTDDYIVIDRSITVDGANHTIDASGVKRVFWVTADNVCIKNVNFINGRTTGLAGGVITWWGNNGTLENCSFTNNSATSAGGAVLWRGDCGSITNCNFTGNDVKIGAAVSLTDGDGFDPSQMHIQIVNSEGGALYLSGNDISVNQCGFENNVALLNGGAMSVSWGSNVTVSNSRFKNNTATYNGGAIDWNGDEAILTNSVFENNSPNNLFLNTNAVIINSTFDKRYSIDSWYNVSYIDVVFKDIGSFDELEALVNITPEGGILVLDQDYEYVNTTTNKGILISKSITIDGAGHTLNGNHLSRMFNVTADNVTLKNINFVNGNAFGRYGGIAGGGAIYWFGANGFIENCRFINNTGYGIEDDPYDKEETYIDENGMVIHVYRVRPMGAKTNEGGAIVWNGINGTVSGCLFTRCSVGYPNSGGAIMWRGDNGKIISSVFDDNDAWCGSSICWVGNNGTISHSIVANSTFFDGGIYWFGANGCVINSLLIDTSNRGVLRGSVEVAADYNFWGDTLENPNAVGKTANVSKWLLMKFSNNGQFVEKGQKVIIKYDITTLTDKDGNLSNYYEWINYSSQISYTADKAGFLNVTFKNGRVVASVDAKVVIKSSDLTKYYSNGKLSYSVKVDDYTGKVTGKKVKFTIGNKNYYVKTNENGVATLKINLKPGTYAVYTSYNGAKVKNKITVKSTLITKDVTKKVKKSGKFTVKVLNSKGKANAKKMVKVQFKGKTYKIKTNSKGIASFDIPKNLKVGKYTIKATCNGLKNSNKIIVKK